MQRRLALLVLTIAVVCGAVENNQFYAPIRNDDLATLSQLIRGAGPGARDSRGNSPLMYAAALGSTESMRLLLKAGADPNATNDFGATPLMWCAGDAVKVRMLLDKGARVDVRSKAGRTPLIVAAAYDGVMESATLMIKKGADVNAMDEGGMTALEQAAGANHTELARLLLDKGAKVNAVDGGGFTALHSAAGNGNAAMVKLLLERGAAVNATSGEHAEPVKNGFVAVGRVTPLQWAAQIASYESVELLVKAGADVNAKDIREATPLVFAVTNDQADPRIVQLLLSKGAARQPGLSWARRYQNPEILRVLGLRPEPMASASASGGTRLDARQAITKALSVSQAPASKFLGTGGCIACHAQNLNGMAVAAAKVAGLKQDATLEAAATRATTALFTPMQEQFFQAQDPPGGVEMVEYSILQMTSGGVPATLGTDALVHYIAATQRKEGDWPIVTGRPPLDGSSFSQTARAIRALRAYAVAGRKTEFDERVARAAAWMARNEPLTTDDRAGQILGLQWAGQSVPAARIRDLTAKQRADGGWAQTDNLATDAYATGEVLWSLHEAGMAASDPVFRRGVDYLLRTQQQDGSWHVVTRALGIQPYFQSGFPYGHDQWISQAGTAMAAIGLTFAAQ